MTRAPLPPPFPVGTRIRCIDQADDLSITVDGKHVQLYGFGLEVVVDKTVAGRQGTGKLVDLDDGDEPIKDETRDGYSVYHVAGAPQHGRVIEAKNGWKWKVIR